MISARARFMGTYAMRAYGKDPLNFPSLYPVMGKRRSKKQRNKAKARIKWMFTVDRARTKLEHAYPCPLKES